MPNIKSAKKKVINNDFRASMRTAIKNVEKAVLAGNKEEATNALPVAIKRIDKAASKGLVHKNYVARQKSRLTKKVNELNK